MGGKPSKPMIPDRLTHWAFVPDKRFHSTPMQSDFLEYKTISPDDWFNAAGEGAIGIGTVRLEVCCSYKGSKAWRFIEFKNVRHVKGSERQIGREKGEYSNAEEEPLGSGPGWSDTLVVDTERRTPLFIVRNGFIYSAPCKKLGTDWN
ncbi:uncharacterized protein Bfra_007091 [Botrytis fragariae]|uniref:Uncharacterized protein n=1 Tax=Botrytis fragariae TaxID=1964551 RepID=A0A8H6AHR8_9HELO|nr:uncharacterized protein Bfra_007091 [Botrytis fragariae]KAF5867896.1 hypothetical protein Bfra_007091 [Botrytis fragariae]